MKKTDLSVVIIARNEEENLPKCLKKCDFAKEIILVDDHSEDKTVEIAQSFGAKVFTRALNGNWGEQQTFAINQASCKWILLLDCDEFLTDELIAEIKNKVELDEPFSYQIKRRNLFYHHAATHGSMRDKYVLRLMPRENAKVEGIVHPVIVTPFPSKKLRSYLKHNSYKDADQYFNKINKYAKLSSEKYLKQQKSINFFADIVLRPMWAAFKVYFINLGFLDGKMGFILASNHYAYVLQKYARYYFLKSSKGKF